MPHLCLLFPDFEMRPNSLFDKDNIKRICDPIRKIHSLMGHLVFFWCDWPGMISDLTMCSKKNSESSFVITGENDLRLLCSHRLVSISHCSLTVKLHDQHCHPKPTLLMYKSSLGSDYHSVLAACATVALFLLTAPSFPPPLFPSSVFLHT